MKKSFPMTPARYYNHLKDCGEYLIKSSIDIAKITAECVYYENLPKELEGFHPKFLGRTNNGLWENGYKIEKVQGHDFGLAFCGVVQASADLQKLLTAVERYISEVNKIEVSREEFEKVFEIQIINRAKHRLEELKRQSYFNQIEKTFIERGYLSAQEFMNKLNELTFSTLKSENTQSLWSSHGDLCFSNIILVQNHLLLVDPRGLSNDKDDGMLVPYYDLAKISQCMLGGYDFINNGVEEKLDFTVLSKNTKAFESFCEKFGVSLKMTRLVEAGHFFSMLPLHISTPSKVIAFANRAVDIYEEFNA